ncbi:MAG: proprotein convertase P-domain-containing protein [Helicobacteraceae bacterium]
MVLRFLVFVAFLLALLGSCGGGGSNSAQSDASIPKGCKGSGFKPALPFTHRNITPSENNIQSYAAAMKFDGFYGILEFPDSTASVQNKEQARVFLLERLHYQFEKLGLAPALEFHSELATPKSKTYKFTQGGKSASCGSSINLTVIDGKPFKIYALVADTKTCKPHTEYEQYPPEFVALMPPLGKPEQTKTLVFDPDALTMTRGALVRPKDSESFASVIAENLYIEKDVTASRAGGKLYFANERLIGVDLNWLQRAPNEALEPDENCQGLQTQFRAKVDGKSFGDQMAFWHINDSMDYLERLGYKIFNTPLLYDANAQTSVYYPSLKLILYGVRGSLDALDASIIRHEFGHAVNYHLVSDFKAGDTGAISEGFADFWAGAHNLWVQRASAEPYELNAMFLFDNHFFLEAGVEKRRLDEVVLYNPHKDYPAHLYKGDQINSYPLFQSLKEAVSPHAFRSYDATRFKEAYDAMITCVLEGTAGLGYATKTHQYARSIVETARRLYPDKPYAKIFEKYYKKNNSLQDLLSLEAPSAYTLQKAQLNLKNMSFEPLAVQAEINGEQRSFTLARGETKSLDVADMQNLACKAKQDVKITLSAKASGQIAFRQEREFRFFKGEPVKVENNAPQKLKDAQKSKSALSHDRQGLTSSELEITDGVIGEFFSVGFEIEHEDSNELRVVLTSPQSLGNRDYELARGTGERVFRKVLSIDSLQDLRGKEASGKWKLKVYDSSHGNTGSLKSWFIAKDIKCN